MKCRCKRVGEAPIDFAQRAFGESKLTVRQQLLYVRHLRRLAIFKFGIWSHLASSSRSVCSGRSSTSWR